MVEVFAHPETARLWIEAAAGRPDWDAIFAGYGSMVDYPGAQYWRQIAAYYPQAKVLHSVRDPEAWFDSTQATIFAPDGPTSRPGPMEEFFASFSGEFRDHMHDRAFMTDYFCRHTEKVNGPSRLRDCWCMRSARVGDLFAISWRSRFRRRPFPTRIHVPNSSPVSGARLFFEASIEEYFAERRSYFLATDKRELKNSAAGYLLRA